MAKRFMDTGTFKDSFVKSLHPDFKLLWLYILCDCDHAGIWEIELDVACMRCGIQERNLQEVKEQFGEKVQILEGEMQLHIPSFITFQYSNLNPANRTHLSVIRLLEAKNIKTLTSPLQAPFEGAKDKDKDKDKENKKVSVIFPIDGMGEIWETWKQYKKDQFGFRYKGNVSEQSAITELYNLANDLPEAEAIVMQSISNGWKGFFNLKAETKPKKANTWD